MFQSRRDMKRKDVGKAGKGRQKDGAQSSLVERKKKKMSTFNGLSDGK